MIAFGARADQTLRGMALKELISYGASFGEVTIKLHNEGPDAFQKQKYGPTIVIKRRINGNGATNVRISNHEGQVITDSRSALYEINGHFGIDVTNPLTILQQDTAKTFISRSNDADKYRFFYEGTGLKRLADHYDQLWQCILVMRESVTELIEVRAARQISYEDRRSTQNVGSLRNDAKEAKKRLAKVREHRAIEEDIIRYEDELAWVDVAIIEKASVLPSWKCRIIPGLTFFCLRSMDEMKAKSAEFRLSDSEEALKLAAEQVSAIKSRLRDLHTQKVDIIDNIKRLKQEDQQIQSRIDVERGKTVTRHRSTIEAKLQEKIQLQSEAETVRDQLAQLKNDGDVGALRHSEAIKRLHELENRRGGLIRDLGQSFRERQSYESRVRDRGLAYGRSLPNILREIDHLEAIGNGRKPLQLSSEVGEYLQEAPSRAISYFITRSQADLDFRNGMPSGEFVTTLSTIEITHPVVLKHLVLSSRIESVTFWDTRMEAQCVYGSNGNRFPRNVSSMLTLDERDVGSRSGGILVKSIFPPRFSDQQLSDASASRLAQDQHMRDNERLTVELQECDREIGIVKQNLAKAKEAQQRLFSSSKPLGLRLKKLENRISLLQEQVSERADASVFAELSDIKDRVAAQIRELESQFTDLVATIESLKVGELDKAVQDANQLKVKLMEKKSTAREIDNQLLALNADVLRKQSYKLNVEAKMEATEGAETHCQRVPVTHTKSQLERKLTEERSRLREREKIFGSREELEQEFQTKESAYKAAVANVENLGKVPEKLEQAYELRRTKFIYLRKLISSRARMHFTNLLSRRAYKGTIRIDHAAQMLKLTVEDTTTLSGGEKSYTQVCLLLSFWEAMGSPIRALDEFDVFMDAVNRTVSLGLLSEFALDHNNSLQYIFITPQDGNTIVDIDGTLVRMHRLKDPVRDGSEA
ncbi:hypothetical protein M427DRAFT_42365 [Gonapodya prolifera JEL478]|uniref:RecF/RecN/SMC N-terminal domain-containing protein n=1 Tax=Gonapodya prolifera (strain JEL478) TaxID=1344416 RepID=A0A139APQ9_GONPJ|nr:hypothetical protein M427DRAFT_42365 [Gonapodya prolifera JEL478]|eukprot:KXS18708.1 hypothetical protein M427DRAFT_42365 [Gonapodya prolifera JEL478]